MLERRKYERTNSTVKVEIYHPSFGTYIGLAKDISAGGVQVNMENQICPPIGTEVLVRFSKTFGAINEEALPMRVMHHFRNGLGLMFIQ
jgi:c-di-GMP-binding flagellar brake protein YcgR